MNVSRYIDTVELKFDVEFVTPCFLGGADGNADIRVAPFKNLLRRWWRIANGHLSPEELWKKESRLFGSTEKDPDIVEENKKLPKEKRKPETFGKSKVELKLLEISPNDNYTCSEKIFIGKNEKTDLALYTGYGSVNMGKTYIKNQTNCSFILSCPTKNEFEFEKTLFCMHLFGTIGSRSRNGWGAISVQPKSFKFDPQKYFPTSVLLEEVMHNSKNYPYCIGKDEKGLLCWQTVERYRSWMSAFEDIATVYHQLVSTLNEDDKKYKTKWRYLLGFAKANERLPSQLLLKICTVKTKTSSGVIQKQYFGQIVHAPYRIEGWNEEKYGNQLDAWKYIHEYLDGDPALKGMFGRNVKGGTAK